MRKVIKRAKGAALAGILAAGMMLGGCGKNASVWEVTVDDIKYDLSAPFAENTEKAISEDLVVADPYYGKLYDEDGELSDKTLFKELIPAVHFSVLKF